MMRDQDATPYRLGRPADAVVAAPAAPPEGTAWPAIPEGWLALHDAALGLAPGHAPPLVLLQPGVGVAILGGPDEAEAALRARLEAVCFAGSFPGHLPVARLDVPPEGDDTLDATLTWTFAGLPRLTVPGGDAWVGMVRRALRPPEAPGVPADPRPRAASLPPAAEATGWRPAWIGGGIAAVAVLAGLVALLAPGLGSRPDGTPPGEPATAAPATAPAPLPLAAVPPGEADPPPVAPSPLAPSPMAPSPLAEAPTASLPPEPPPPAMAPPPMEPRPAPPAAPAAPPAAADQLPRVTVRSGANLRSTPDRKGGVLRTLPAGTVLRVHGEAKGGWLQVGDARPEGWVHASLLSRTLLSKTGP